ncbi:MAG: RNA polymerase sigma factor [Sandaracinaceae bacterium]|nr:RNA polymerase sigma factor [Sandaracinaceae bacterium]
MSATPTLERERAASASEERALVLGLRRGEAEALGVAYDAHHEAVRRFARQLLADDDAAEDVVHDVFVRLPSASRRFEGRSSLRTFLVSITANVVRHTRRATARRLGAYERLHDEPREPGEDVEDARERRALVELMDRLLLRLPMDQRLVVVLCVVEDRTSTEVAEILAVPEGTVRTRLFHARKKLREWVDEEARS